MPKPIPQDSSKPILIAHVIHRLQVGGLENGLVNIINRLPEDKFRHAIICLTESSDFAKRIIPKVEIVELHKREGKDPGLYWRLFKTFLRLKPDIVHTRNVGTIEAQVPAFLSGVKFRIHGLHGWDVHDMHGDNVRYQRLHRIVGRFVHRFIPLSDDLENYLIQKIGVSSGKITKICNGVDTEKFSPRTEHPHPSPIPQGRGGNDEAKSERIRNASPLSEGGITSNALSLREGMASNSLSLEGVLSNSLSPRERVGVRADEKGKSLEEKNTASRSVAIPWSNPDLLIIGTVGRLEVVKDQTNLIQAFIQLLKENPHLKKNVRLMLVGDGSLRPQIETMLSDADLSEYVWLAGARDDVPDLMRAMDLFVLPSKAEGISNTILEAMASGLPVVATDVGGNSQLVEGGLTGCLVPRENSGELAASIKKYVIDQNLLVEHAAAARQTAKDTYSLERMVRNYQGIYQRVEVGCSQRKMS